MHEPIPSSAPPIVEICRVTRRFGTPTALDDVSLTVPRGGVFGLIGGNGAGKTTLIKHVLGSLGQTMFSKYALPKAAQLSFDHGVGVAIGVATGGTSDTARASALRSIGCTNSATCFDDEPVRSE